MTARYEGEGADWGNEEENKEEVDREESGEEKRDNKGREGQKRRREIFLCISMAVHWWHYYHGQENWNILIYEQIFLYIQYEQK